MAAASRNSAPSPPKNMMNAPCTPTNGATFTLKPPTTHVPKVHSLVELRVYEFHFSAKALAYD